MADKISLILARKLGGKKGFFAAKAGLLEAKNHVREGVLNALLYGKAAGGGGTDTTVTGSLPLTLADALAKPIVSLTREGKVEQRNLPQGYTEVEYLQTDGNSYIDTGIAVPTSYKWELTVNSRGTNTSPYWGYSNTNSYSSATSFYSLGANGSTGVSGIVLSIGAYSGTAETGQSSFFNAVGITDAGTLGGDAPHTIRCEGNFVFTADGTPMTQVVAKTFAAFTPTGNAYLFARNTPSISKAGNGARIHGYKVWNASDVLVQNLIPAKRNSDNVVGMYDTVSGNFFTNAGTGSFTAGDAITSPTPDRPVDLWTNNGVIKARHESGLPLGYTLLDYARSNGTQYIDLGYKGNGNTKVEVKFKYHTATTTSGSGRVFGSRTTAQSLAFAIGTSSGYVSSGAANQLFWCYDSQSFYVDSTRFGLEEWKTVVFSATEHTIDGVSVGDDYNIVEFETPQNLKLFGFDNGGTMGFGYVDVAYCKLWDNGVLVRNLVPAKNAANVVGMYDFVSGDFLTNDGTGDFVAGSVVSDPVEIYTDGTPEVLKVCGANLFDKNAVSFYTLLDTSTGAEIPQSEQYSWASGWIPVTPSTEYYFKSGASYPVRIFEYSADKTYLNLNYTKQNASFTVGATCGYIRFHLGHNAGGQAMYNGETMVSMGSTAPAAYEPYTAQTASVPDILAVADYKDAAEIIGGLKTGKVGVYVCTGAADEGWAYDSPLTAMFCLDAAITAAATQDRTTPCTHFKTQSTLPPSAGGGRDGFCERSSEGRIGIGYSAANGDVPTWKAFLAAQYAADDPVIILFPLATETTEQTTPQPLTTAKGTNVVSSENNVPSVSATVVYKKR